MSETYYVDTRELDSQLRVQLSSDAESREKMLSHEAEELRAETGAPQSGNVYDSFGAPAGQRVEAESLGVVDDGFAAYVAQSCGPLSHQENDQLVVETVGEAEALLFSFRRVRHRNPSWMTLEIKNSYARCEDALTEKLQTAGYSVEWTLPDKSETFGDPPDEVWEQKAKQRPIKVEVTK